MFVVRVWKGGLGLMSECCGSSLDVLLALSSVVSSLCVGMFCLDVLACAAQSGQSTGSTSTISKLELHT